MSAGLGGAVILLTPLVWAVDWTPYLPLSMASYFNSTRLAVSAVPVVGYVFSVAPWDRPAPAVPRGWRNGSPPACWRSEAWF